MGQGPAPKANRQRKQTPHLGEWQRLEPLAGPVLCDLSDLDVPDQLEQWPMRSRLLWESWQEDPITQTWNAGDKAFAVDTIYLHAAGADAKASEIRIRMESLGLTPKGRRDGRWLLPDEPVPDTPDADSPPPPIRQLPEAV